MQEENENILRCRCSKCGRKGMYAMDGEELALKREYAERGRSMGALRNIFPGVPEWILYGALDPMAGGRCVCPSCQKK